MTDHGIESALRRYRPVGPPADLAARLVPVRSPWPWAAAAAVLLALALGARAGVDNVVARFPASPDPASGAVAELTELLGGDAMARDVAELMVAEQQLLRERARER